MFPRSKLSMLVTLSILSLAILLSCASRKITDQVTPEERMDIALKWFNNGHYLDARTQFRILTLSHGGTHLADKAQFYLAECHYSLKEFILAANEYERLLKVFPNSDYVDDSKFKLGMSYYKLAPKFSLDQEYTRQSIQIFQEFLEEYHNSKFADDVERYLSKCRQKLARKAFVAAVQYRKMSYYTASTIYLNKVLEQYYDSDFAPRAQYLLADNYMHLQEYEKAKKEALTFLEKYPQHDWSDRAGDLLEKSEKELEKQAKTQE